MVSPVVCRADAFAVVRPVVCRADAFAVVCDACAPFVGFLYSFAVQKSRKLTIV